MPVLVVLGAVLMGSGIVLIFVPRRSKSPRQAWNEFSAASLGRIGRLLDHITRIDGELAGLERAIDAVIPVRSEDEISTACCDEVATAYADACSRLVELSRVNLRAVPSTALMRFTELSGAIGQGHDALDNGRHTSATCISLLRHLDAVGSAIQSDRRRLRLASEPTDVLLRELACALRIALTTHLDTLRTALGRRRPGTARALRKRDRAALAAYLDHTQTQLNAGDWLARGDPLAALQALAALPLPLIVGVPPDTAFATACGAVEAGLRVSAAGRDACLDERTAHYGAVVDRHLRDLLTTVAAAAQERRRLDHASPRPTQAEGETLAASPVDATLVPQMRRPDHDQFDVRSLTSHRRERANAVGDELHRDGGQQQTQDTREEVQQRR